MQGYLTEEAIEKLIPAPNDFIDFTGNNCDDCVGWYGHSRRCECGNRRVSWIIDKQDDGSFLAFAEAY